MASRLSVIPYLPMSDREPPAARRRKRGKVEITEKMISDAADVLWLETSCICRARALETT
jgi:hypothetical protein